jgi:hypothetical protein
MGSATTPMMRVCGASFLSEAAAGAVAAFSLIDPDYLHAATIEPVRRRTGTLLGAAAASIGVLPFAVEFGEWRSDADLRALHRHSD